MVIVSVTKGNLQVGGYRLWFDMGWVPPGLLAQDTLRRYMEGTLRDDATTFSNGTDDYNDDDYYY